MTSKWKQLLIECLAEFAGTFMLMVIGCTANAQLSLNPQMKMPLDKSGPSLQKGFFWGFGAMIGIMCSINISGGHINPAVTISLASLRRFPWSKVAPYCLSQLLGSITGSAIVYYLHIEAISKQHSFSPIDVNLHLRTIGHNFSTGGIFATFPEAHITTLFGALRDGIIATAILMFGVQAVCDKNNLNVSRQTQPIYLAFLVAVMSQGFSFNAGAALNPARDFGPRLFMAISDWGNAAFEPLHYCYWWSGGIVGPIIGAVLGVWLYYFLIEIWQVKEEEPKIKNPKSKLLPSESRISIVDYGSRLSSKNLLDLNHNADQMFYRNKSALLPPMHI